ncbi:hypothetical protein [Cellulomonas sp. B6]|uniref:hypothetical protein n=1 Tax=Cellulomonas sp. B6 TaxID=1295626 RepID=UPI0012374520|nr:hypothetical protein [Cellulomonas sp. B6]
MGDDLAQILVAALGIVGTLAASLLAQVLSQKAERERRKAEDETRWLPNRFEVATELLSKSGAVHRKLYSAAAFLNAPSGPIEDRPLWLAGHMNLLAAPEAGVSGIITAEDREILLEMQQEIVEELDAMEDLVSRITLLSTEGEATAARGMHEALWNAEGYLEMYAPGNLAYPAIHSAEKAIAEFTAATRRGLRVSTPTDGTVQEPS